MSTTPAPLRRRFDVRLTSAEIAAFHAVRSDPHPGAAEVPWLRVREGSRWTVTLLRRMGSWQGVVGARAEVRLVADDRARVEVRSGGLVAGWTCAGLAFLLALSPLLVLAPGEWVEQPAAGPLGAAGLGFVAWLLLARRFRESGLDVVETCVRQRLGGRWDRAEGT